MGRGKERGGRGKKKENRNVQGCRAWSAAKLLSSGPWENQQKTQKPSTEGRSVILTSFLPEKPPFKVGSDCGKNILKV